MLLWLTCPCPLQQHSYPDLTNRKTQNRNFARKSQFRRNFAEISLQFPFLGLSMHVRMYRCMLAYAHARMHACIKSVFAHETWASPASGGPGRTGEATAGVFWSESALQSVPLCNQSPAASCQGRGKGALQTEIEELGSGRFCTIISTQD